MCFLALSDGRIMAAEHPQRPRPRWASFREAAQRPLPVGFSGGEAEGARRRRSPSVEALRREPTAGASGGEARSARPLWCPSVEVAEKWLPNHLLPRLLRETTATSGQVTSPGSLLKRRRGVPRQQSLEEDPEMPQPQMPPDSATDCAIPEEVEVQATEPGKQAKQRRKKAKRKHEPDPAEERAGRRNRWSPRRKGGGGREEPEAPTPKRSHSQRPGPRTPPRRPDRRLNMEGIFFRSEGGYQAYRVSWYVGRKKKYKNFAPKDYGGRDQKAKLAAFRAAQAFRDSLREQGSVRARNQRNAAAWPPSNVKGVRWHRRAKAWYSNLQVGGRVFCKYFSPTSFGGNCEAARAAAIKFRYELERTHAVD